MCAEINALILKFINLIERKKKLNSYRYFFMQTLLVDFEFQKKVFLEMIRYLGEEQFDWKLGKIFGSNLELFNKLYSSASDTYFTTKQKKSLQSIDDLLNHKDISIHAKRLYSITGVNRARHHLTLSKQLLKGSKNYPSLVENLNFLKSTVLSIIHFKTVRQLQTVLDNDSSLIGLLENRIFINRLNEELTITPKTLFDDIQESIDIPINQKLRDSVLRKRNFGFDHPLLFLDNEILKSLAHFLEDNKKHSLYNHVDLKVDDDRLTITLISDMSVDNSYIEKARISPHFSSLSDQLRRYGILLFLGQNNLGFFETKISIRVVDYVKI